MVKKHKNIILSQSHWRLSQKVQELSFLAYMKSHNTYIVRIYIDSFQNIFKISIYAYLRVY